MGAGLLGASLAKALKERGLADSVSVWSRSESTRGKCAKLADVFDGVFDTPQGAVADADLTVLCVPTENIPELAAKISDSLKDGAILTDVGSVKSKICAECSKALEGKNAVFVGSHPMAGSEKIGVDYSDSALFEGRPCFVVSDDHDSPQTQAVAKMWNAVGMKICFATPAEHDAIVARVSHLVHLVAGTLCLVAADYKTDLRRYSGPGFRDTTRVASGSPDIWESIIPDNRGEILAALKEYRASLDSLISAVETLDKPVISKRLRDAKAYRDGLK